MWLKIIRITTTPWGKRTLILAHDYTHSYCHLLLALTKDPRKMCIQMGWNIYCSCTYDMKGITSSKHTDRHIHRLVCLPQFRNVQFVLPLLYEMFLKIAHFIADTTINSNLEKGCWNHTPTITVSCSTLNYKARGNWNS